MKRFEFHTVFQLTRKIIFEVDYYTLGSNDSAYFTTSACEFNQPKTDFNRGGQAQKDLCFGPAKTFYEKWDKYHLHRLDDEHFEEMIKDLEALKQHYNYIENKADFKPEDIRFWQEKELSMQKVKKVKQ
jgi:hypothetical protein